MHFYQIKLGLNSSQSVLMDLLKGSAAEVIQISDGLCVKTTQTLQQLTNLLKDVESRPTVVKLDKDEVQADSNATENLKSFMGIS